MPTLPVDDFGQRIQVLRPGTAQTVPIGAVSEVSAPFGPSTTVVRLVATAHCFLAVGGTPVAADGGHYLPAGVPEYFRVAVGESIAVVRTAHDGTLHVSEMT